MRCAATAISLLVLGVSNPVRADDACPWLTSGSAIKLLGDSATAVNVIQGEQKGSCTYTGVGTGRRIKLAIFVGLLPTLECTGQAENLKAIGTSAKQCKSSTGGLQTNQVTGTVREVRFAVVLQLPDSPGDAKQLPMQPDELVRQAAEQVAGNLF